MAHGVRGAAPGGLPGVHGRTHPGGRAEHECETGREQAEAHGHALQEGGHRPHARIIHYPPRVYPPIESDPPAYIVRVGAREGSTSASRMNGKAHGR